MVHTDLLLEKFCMFLNTGFCIGSSLLRMVGLARIQLNSFKQFAHIEGEENWIATLHFSLVFMWLYF